MAHEGRPFGAALHDSSSHDSSSHDCAPVPIGATKVTAKRAAGWLGSTEHRERGATPPEITHTPDDPPLESLQVWSWKSLE